MAAVVLKCVDFMCEPPTHNGRKGDEGGLVGSGWGAGRRSHEPSLKGPGPVGGGHGGLHTNLRYPDYFWELGRGAGGGLSGREDGKVGGKKKEGMEEHQSMEY